MLRMHRGYLHQTWKFRHLFKKQFQQQCQLCGRHIKHWPLSSDARRLQPVRCVSYAIAEIHATNSVAVLNGIPPPATDTSESSEKVVMKPVPTPAHLTALTDAEKRRLFYKCAGCRTLDSLYFVLKLKSTTDASLRPFQSVKSLAQLYTAFQGRSAVPALSHPLMLELEKALAENIDRLSDIQSLLEVLRFVQAHTTDEKLQRNFFLVILNVIETSLPSYTSQEIMSVVKNVNELTQDPADVRGLTVGAWNVISKRNSQTNAMTVDEILELFLAANKLDSSIRLSSLLQKLPSRLSNPQMISIAKIATQVDFDQRDPRTFVLLVDQHLKLVNVAPVPLLRVLSEIVLKLKKSHNKLSIESMLVNVYKHWEWCWYLSNLSRSDRQYILSLSLQPVIRRYLPQVVGDQVVDFTQHASMYSDAEMACLLKVLAYYNLHSQIKSPAFRLTLNREIDKRYSSMDVDQLLTIFESLCILPLFARSVCWKYINSFFLSRVYSKSHLHLTTKLL